MNNQIVVKVSIVALVLVVGFALGCSRWERKEAVTPQPHTEMPKPETEKIQDRLTLNLNFDPGQAVIKEEDYGKLDQAITVINKHPKSPIRIEGHTDNDGSREFNHELSHKRADAVKRYLAVHGAGDESKMKTIGFGETKPVASNDTPEGRQKNRRVELFILAE